MYIMGVSMMQIHNGPWVGTSCLFIGGIKPTYIDFLFIGGIKPTYVVFKWSLQRRFI